MCQSQSCMNSAHHDDGATSFLQPAEWQRLTSPAPGLQVISAAAAPPGAESRRTSICCSPRAAAPSCRSRNISFEQLIPSPQARAAAAARFSSRAETGEDAALLGVAIPSRAALCGGRHIAPADEIGDQPAARANRGTPSPCGRRRYQLRLARQTPIPTQRCEDSPNLHKPCDIEQRTRRCSSAIPVNFQRTAPVRRFGVSPRVIPWCRAGPLRSVKWRLRHQLVRSTPPS